MRLSFRISILRCSRERRQRLRENIRCDLRYFCNDEFPDPQGVEAEVVKVVEEAAVTDSTAAILHEAARLHREGNLERAEASYRAAAASATGASERYVALLGVTRVAVDLARYDAAVEACREAIECAPGRAGPYAVLAHALGSAGRLDEAAEAAEAALERAPQDRLVLNLAASIALRRGMPSVAIGWSRRALALDPHDQRALADLAFALDSVDSLDSLDAGDGTLAAASLLDFPRLVRVTEAATPAGFASIDAFNRELAEAIVAAPSLRAPTGGLPLVGGRRLPDTFAAATRWTEPLRVLLRSAVEDYIRNLAVEASHPAMTGRPSRVELVSWANLMLSGDYERVHIHEGGWLSGTYYVEMPPAAEGRADGSQGALLIGGHHCEIGPSTALHRIDPRPGQIVLFPSYLSHRTEPFFGPGRRISVAFDVRRL